MYINSWVLYLIPILDSLLVFLKVSFFGCILILGFIAAPVNDDIAPSAKHCTLMMVIIAALIALIVLIPSSDTAIKLYLNNNGQSVEQTEKNLEELIDGSRRIDELINSSKKEVIHIHSKSEECSMCQ